MAIAVHNPENPNDDSQIPGPPLSPPMEMTIFSCDGKPLPPPHITHAVLNLNVHVLLEHMAFAVRANNLCFTIDVLRRLGGGELPYLRCLRLNFECTADLVELLKEIFFDALVDHLKRTGTLIIKAEKLEITVAGHRCGEECATWSGLSTGTLHVECLIADDLRECIRIHPPLEEATDNQERELVIRTK